MQHMRLVEHQNRTHLTLPQLDDLGVDLCKHRGCVAERLQAKRYAQGFVKVAPSKRLPHISQADLHCTQYTDLNPRRAHRQAEPRRASSTPNLIVSTSTSLRLGNHSFQAAISLENGSRIRSQCCSQAFMAHLLYRLAQAATAPAWGRTTHRRPSPSWAANTGGGVRWPAGWPQPGCRSAHRTRRMALY